MRWLYYDPQNRREAAEHAQVLAKIDAWWEAFKQRESEIGSLLNDQAGWDLPAWMEQTLQAVHPELMWEFGPALQSDGHRLVITPESARHLRPLLHTLLQRAPKLPTWEFYAYRQPEQTVAAVLNDVAARVEFDLSAATVAAHIDDGKRIDLCYFLPGLTARDAELAQGAAFVATESLLGEEMLDRWIDTIDVAATRKFSPGEGRPLPLDRMQPTVTALIGSLQEQLPSEPTSRLVDGVEWAGFEMHPEEADADYAARNDLYVAVSGRPDVFTAAHRGSVFDSQCYSRFDETFCYLKIDAESGLEGCQYQGRDELEEALNNSLRTANLGCCFGGGTGLAYSYIDLALTDVRRAAELIRGILQPARIPRRTWLQFFDDTLAHEWIGIYPDSPPPPISSGDED